MRTWIFSASASNVRGGAVAAWLARMRLLLRRAASLWTPSVPCCAMEAVAGYKILSSFLQPHPHDPCHTGPGEGDDDVSADHFWRDTLAKHILKE